MKDWRNEIAVSDKYKKHNEEFLQILSDFEKTLDRQLDRIRTVKHQIERKSTDIRPVYSARYRAGPTLRNFTAKDIQKCSKKKLSHRLTQNGPAPSS